MRVEGHVSQPRCMLPLGAVAYHSSVRQTARAAPRVAHAASPAGHARPHLMLCVASHAEKWCVAYSRASAIPTGHRWASPCRARRGSLKSQHTLSSTGMGRPRAPSNDSWKQALWQVGLVCQMAAATASPEWDWPSGITLIVLWPAFEGTDPGQLETEHGRRKGAQGMTMRRPEQSQSDP